MTYSRELLMHLAPGLSIRSQWLCKARGFVIMLVMLANSTQPSDDKLHTTLSRNAACRSYISAD